MVLLITFNRTFCSDLTLAAEVSQDLSAHAFRINHLKKLIIAREIENLEPFFNIQVPNSELKQN